MTVQHHNIQQDQDGMYNFYSPLWDQYFRNTRERVRFPRNYKEVSALMPGSELED